MVGECKPRWSLVFPKSFGGVPREMDELFGTVFGNGSEASWAAPASLWEEEGRWCVEVDLPGVQLADVEVTLEKNSLRISAERKPHDENRKFWHQERAFGRIDRLITLPETVDPDGINAELKDGVLRLHLAKRPESQPRKINVKTN